MPDNRAMKLDKTPTPIIGGVISGGDNSGGNNNEIKANNARGGAGATSFSNVAGNNAAGLRANTQNAASEADSESALAEIVAHIKDAENILIALSDAPTIDELVAAIGLYLYLDRNEKHATVVYSGAIPKSLVYLHPEKIFEENTDTLQDFVISLDKEKADHLRYKLEGDFVKIYITPYRSKVSEKDLIFSHGDFNVDLVIALNVSGNAHIEAELREHTRIFRDATVLSIVAGAPLKFGETEWCNPRASSLSEMMVKLLSRINPEILIDETEATALLTGIISATERFSNRRTTAETFQVASRLMEAGGNQQIVSENLALEGFVQKKTPGNLASVKKPKAAGATQEIQDQKANGGIAGAIGRLEIKRAKKIEKDREKAARNEATEKNPANLKKNDRETFAPKISGPEKTTFEPKIAEVEEITASKEPTVPTTAPVTPTSMTEAEKPADTSSVPEKPADSPVETIKPREKYEDLSADLDEAVNNLVKNAGAETVKEEKPVVQISEKDSLPPAEFENSLSKDASSNSNNLASTTPAAPAVEPKTEPINFSANGFNNRTETVIQPLSSAAVNGVGSLPPVDTSTSMIAPSPTTSPSVNSTFTIPSQESSSSSQVGFAPAASNPASPAEMSPAGVVPMGASSPAANSGIGMPNSMQAEGTDLLPPPPTPPVDFSSAMPTSMLGSMPTSMPASMPSPTSAFGAVPADQAFQVPGM